MPPKKGIKQRLGVVDEVPASGPEPASAPDVPAPGPAAAGPRGGVKRRVDAAFRRVADASPAEIIDVDAGVS